MKKLVLPTAVALLLGLSGTAWAGCGSHTSQSTAEAPVEKPVETPSG
jgi:hypothetical protein